MLKPDYERGGVTVAALYVLSDGPYAGVDGVELWDEERDARNYAGPHPVVAHPPCARWGRYWSGGPSARVRRKLGDDGGCFRAALGAANRWGGVVEHPEGTHAWRAFNIVAPPRWGRWVRAGLYQPGWTCCVEQGHYGHPARKATWLYVAGTDALPEFKWGKSEARGKFEESFRSAEARRRAVKTGAGKRLSKRQRQATPAAFRDALLAIARSCGRCDSTSARASAKS